MLVLVFTLLSIGISFAKEGWYDDDWTTRLWRLISEKRSNELVSLLVRHQTEVISYRSDDGRGALFWAYEYGNEEALAILLNFGVDIESDEMMDANGKHPKMMANDPEELIEKAKSLVPKWKKRKKMVEVQYDLDDSYWDSEEDDSIGDEFRDEL